VIQKQVHDQPLLNLAPLYQNAPIIVGLVVCGAIVRQVVPKQEVVVKHQIVKVEHNHRQSLNPVLTPQPVLPTLGNVVIGELAHRKESKPEVAIKLLIVRQLKPHRRQHRNTVKLQTNPNNKHRRKI